AETIDRTRFGIDDAVQLGIGEDDMGGHTLLLGLLGPTGAQGLEQGGVGGVEFCLGPASATGSCLLAAGLLDRIHAERDLLLSTQNGTGGLTDPQHTV